MNTKTFYFIGILICYCFSSCNRPQIKYQIVGSDTIASYIHVGGEDKKDYVIINKDFSDSIDISSYRIPELDLLLKDFGIDDYIKEGHEKKGKEFGNNFYIFVNKYGFSEIEAYNRNQYFLQGYYYIEDDKFIYSERNLRVSYKKQNTILNNTVDFDVEKESYTEYKKILAGKVYSDTLLQKNEIENLMHKNQVENYHRVEFVFNNIGIKHTYAGYVNGEVAYYAGPKTMHEANILGLKKELERIRKSTDELSNRYYNDVVSLEMAIAVLEDNISKTTSIRSKYSNEYSEIAQEAKVLENYIDEQKLKIFPYLRSRYISIANSNGWEHNLEVSGSSKNGVIVFTSYMFASNKNIKDMFEGLEPILKKLRFKEAEFRWTKYSEVISKGIYSKDDNE